MHVFNSSIRFVSTIAANKFLMIIFAETKYVVPKPYFDKHILNEKSKAFARTKAYNALYMNPPNFEELNWPNKWPISKPFNPYLVPLPIR